VARAGTRGGTIIRAGPGPVNLVFLALQSMIRGHGLLQQIA
jgi:hypothetical protein